MDSQLADYELDTLYEPTNAVSKILDMPLTGKGRKLWGLRFELQNIIPVCTKIPSFFDGLYAPLKSVRYKQPLKEGYL
ncbi:hypothetical protein [Rahnella aquatilis]|uniref:hypothetical protein n=1 Tax=Rahnella aquatilis TaxID=34038 RepID=UPI00030DE784|nr:hypothetical protein [Rahnella aquatilis]